MKIKKEKKKKRKRKIKKETSFKKPKDKIDWNLRESTGSEIKTNTN